jgi:ClpP class serine protease
MATAASGGIGSDAMTEIWASPDSITGSIGIGAYFLQLSGRPSWAFT